MSKNSYTRSKRPVKNVLITRKKFTVYLLTLFFAGITIKLLSRLYTNTTILSEHEAVKIKPYWHVETNPWNDSFYEILFYHKGEKTAVGIYPKTYRAYQRNGDVELFYNKEMDEFIDPNCDKFKIYIDIFYAIISMCVLLVLLKEVVFGKFRPCST